MSESMKETIEDIMNSADTCKNIGTMEERKRILKIIHGTYCCSFCRFKPNCGDRKNKCPVDIIKQKIEEKDHE